MLSDAEIEARFWKELRANPLIMIGLVGVAETHTQPMRAFFDDGQAPICFFTSRHNRLIAPLAEPRRAIANYVADGQSLFACVHGVLSIEEDAAVIDHYWDSDEPRWYAGGRSDPDVTLLRLDADRAEIWVAETSFGSAITRLLHRDPKQAQAVRTAEVRL